MSLEKLKLLVSFRVPVFSVSVSVTCVFCVCFCMFMLRHVCFCACYSFIFLFLYSFIDIPKSLNHVCCADTGIVVTLANLWAESKDL